METKSLKNNPLQTKTLTPYLLVALTAAIIAVGSFLGGVAYQKSASDTQSGSPMNRNGAFPSNGFRPNSQGGNQGNSLQNGQSGADQSSGSDGSSL